VSPMVKAIAVSLGLLGLIMPKGNPF
jgi:hypothetical protein